MMSPLIRWVPVIAWMAVIFTMSAQPGSALPGRFAMEAHFAEYAILGFLVARALAVRTRGWRSALAGAVIIGSLYGITDELHQAFVPGRTPDVADWAVDTLGAMTGAALFATLGRALLRRAETKRQASQ